MQEVIARDYSTHPLLSLRTPLESDYRARYYDPGVGRFISEDPVQAGPNFYAYVGNRPIDGVDPFGLRCVRKLVLVTAYCDVGPGKDWGYYKSGNPANVGPGTLATANTTPPPYPFGSPVCIANDGAPFFNNGSADPFNSGGYNGFIHDTGAGWNSKHHNVPPDYWFDIWLRSCKDARKFGKQWRWATICTPDCGCKSDDHLGFGRRVF